MAIYAISDLHLSFGTKKSMEVFGKVWENYEERIKENWIKKVNDSDFVIIPGDISWANSVEEAYEDFLFIEKLPGTKILLKGNHDYYFSTVKKIQKFLDDNQFNSIKLLHNSVVDLGKFVLCGTRGWGNTESGYENVDIEKILRREENRLKISLDLAKLNYSSKDILVAMHFPPFISNFQSIMKEYNVKQCIYGHLHGFGHASIKEGNIDGIIYTMVSADYTKFDLIRLD